MDQRANILAKRETLYAEDICLFFEWELMNLVPVFEMEFFS